MPKPTHVITLYRDAAGEPRWRVKTRNGKVVAGSAGDGYKRKATMMRVLDDLIRAMRTGTVEVRDETDKDEA